MFGLHVLLCGWLRHRFRSLVGQVRGDFPGEEVLDHQPILVPPFRVLARDQVRLQPVVRPRRRALPQTPRLGRQHMPGHVAARAAAAHALVRSQKFGEGLEGPPVEAGESATTAQMQGVPLHLMGSTLALCGEQGERSKSGY